MFAGGVDRVVGVSKGRSYPNDEAGLSEKLGVPMVLRSPYSAKFADDDNSSDRQIPILQIP
jgi:hypothetical protein